MPLTYWESNLTNTTSIYKPAMKGTTLHGEANAESNEKWVTDVRAFLKGGPQPTTQTVYKLTPLESSPPPPLRRHDSSFFIQSNQDTRIEAPGSELQRRREMATPLPLPQPQKPKPLPHDMFDSPPPLASKVGSHPISGASTPMAIPGAVENGMERRASLIKAIQAPTRHATPVRSLIPQAKAMPTPEGSWTFRQINNPDAVTSRQPSELNTRTAQAKLRLEAAKAAIRSKAATRPAGKEEAARELVWRLKFKKKWIREELYARKQEFPDDPEYTDNWGEALDFIETCGSRGAMQAAFLAGTAKRDRADLDEEDDLLDEGTMFGEDFGRFDGEPTFDESSLSRRAATLLRLHRQATATTTKAALVY